MKLPKEIQGKNRLRDFDICRLYISGLTATEIKAHRNLPICVRAIEKVISNNAAFVNPRVAWPKSKRIMRLQRLADTVQGKISPSKGELDVLAELRKEIEGEKAFVDASTHHHITVVLSKEEDEQKQEIPTQRPTIEVLPSN